MIDFSCFQLLKKASERSFRSEIERSDNFEAVVEYHYRRSIVDNYPPVMRWSFEVPYKIFADCHSVDVTMTRLENSIQSHALDWVMLKSKISYTDAVQILKDQGNRQVITHISQSELGEHSNYSKNLIADISEDFVDDLDFYTFDAEGTYPADQLVSTFGVCTVKHNTIQRVIFL